MNIVWHLHREPTSLAEERDKPHHGVIMTWHELQRSIREDEVRLVCWAPGFDVLLDELCGSDAGAR